ncbi:hypothetical protein [Treponema bryantii]|uniref:hypothetical protein n=1 Tax=Treponema bryantii TaxID=163 RepID=UPI002B2B7514|nr:hypothetical protein TRBR_14540 [Treponema bryantii]
MLTTFKDLIIEGIDLKKFVQNFEKYVKDEFVDDMWKIENKEDVFFVENTENEAKVCLVYHDYEVKNKIEVTNIIPTNRHALSVDKYNCVLDLFNDEILEKYIHDKSLNVTINISDGILNLEDIFGKQGSIKLTNFLTRIKAFDLEELKEDFNSSKEWYDFVLYSYYSGNLCFNTNEVRNIFADILENGQIADFLSTEYDRMINLLSYYDNEFKYEYRG